MVMGYGMEIWEWKEREELEKIEERYLRWLLSVERRTPGYLVREELQREKLCIRAGRRTWEYKEKRNSEWKKERMEFFERKGIGMEEVKKKHRRD